MQVRNFRFVPQTFGGAILLPMSQIAPPNGSCAQDVAAAGIAVADQCKDMLKCFAESRKYPAPAVCEVVHVGTRPQHGHYYNGPVGTCF